MKSHPYKCPYCDTHWSAVEFLEEHLEYDHEEGLMGCETKKKGDVTEAVSLAELIKLGFVVLVPFGDNQPRI